MKFLPVLVIILSIFLNSCSMLMHNAAYNKYSEEQLKSFEKFAEEKAKESLIEKADKTLHKKFRMITDKSILAKSGDKNDFHSRAVYYWPKKSLSKSAQQDDSWEYVDGKINTESLKETDHENYYKMLTAVKQLALAYHFSSESKYARKCASLINDWFINPQTRMNPHFKYAQAIPGKYDGTPSGIIDARGILWVVDAVEFIKNSEHWTKTMNDEFQDWLAELFDWLLFSDFGKRESMAKNNHGTFYDLQIIKLATVLNESVIAKSFIDSVKIKRIANQIEPNGFQPEEMSRAKAHVYAVFNLSALLDIAFLAQIYDKDLWNYKTADSGSIKDAVDYLVSISKNANNSDLQNLMRILPRANNLSNGAYTDEISEIQKKIKSIDLTELYFVN